jgi:DNA-binding beta-propeller fold protein YncE
MPELAPGAVFSGHRIEAVVGRGGMGVVYRAEQVALGRTVALKVIAPELLDDATTKARFLREARAGASIEHPHVIPLLHADEADGVAYLVMRFVDGDDVRTLLRRTGPLDPQRAAAIGAQVGEALDAIHAAGLVHRDIKPANVLLGSGDHVYVSDFGLAKQSLSHGSETRSGQWVGTLDFVAPEQIRGERVDARTDVYALGGLLFYMLTATAPFSDHEGDGAKLWAHLTETPPPVSSLRPDLPAPFDDVLARAMAKDPDERYPSAGDLGRAGLAAARGEDPAEKERTVAVDAAAPELPTADRPMRLGARPRWAPRWTIAAGGAVAVGVAVVAVILLTGSGGSPRRTGKQAADVHVGLRVNVVSRPNAVVVSGGAAWVSSGGAERVTRLDAVSGRKVAPAPAVGRSVVGMAATGDGVWVALRDPGRIVRFDRSGAQVGSTLRLAGNAVDIDATPEAVWVALDSSRDSVVRYDPATAKRVLTVSPAGGVRAIAAAPDGAWIAHRRAPTVAHLDGRTGRQSRLRRLREPPYDLEYGAGYTWASLRSDNTLAQITPRTGAFVYVAAPQDPRQIATAGGRAFVAGFTAHAVAVIDPRTARQVGRPIPVGLNPFALTGDGTHVWVTSVGSSSVTRLDLS